MTCKIYFRSKLEVAKLLDDFNSKVAPDLSTRETETITSCIVQFLQSFRVSSGSVQRQLA